MGAMPNEPSMEEILSSIKRIIAEEDKGQPAPRGNRSANVAALVESADDQVLELTNALPRDTAESAAVAPVVASVTPIAVVPSTRDSHTAKTEPKTTTGVRATVEARARAREAMTTAASETNVLSDNSAQAARDSLMHLSRLLVRQEDGQSNTLEALVREMLRPMLKEWLDARLPEIVEAQVKREIDRITGRV
jgi:uncharacterized protein